MSLLRISRCMYSIMQVIILNDLINDRTRLAPSFLIRISASPGFQRWSYANPGLERAVIVANGKRTDSVYHSFIIYHSHFRFHYCSSFLWV